MKMPTGKNRNIMIGGAVVGGITLVWYIRKRSAGNSAASSNTATADASAYDPNAIDPNTGLTYGQEDGFGFTPNGALGFGYAGSSVTSGGSATSGLGATYTSNTQWMSDAQQAAQNYYGASYQLASSALGKYISQNSKGLLDNEYQVVSEVVAQIGQPPVGQPYRLIHDNTPPPPSGGETTPPPSGGGTTTPPPNNGGIPPGYHMQPPQVATLPALQSLRTYWQHHYPGNNQALTNLINYNPGIGVDWTAHGNIMIRTSEAHLVPDN